MHIGNQMKSVLVVSALLLLVGNGFILYKNYQTEWRKYQQDYLKLAVEKTTDASLRKILEGRSPRIEQIVATGFGRERVDRCITCHAGIDDERFQTAPQPFRTHPKMTGHHPYRTFGCTTCHDGNGRGLSVSDAHGEGKYWTEPLLQGDTIESSCAKCHGYDRKETPRLRAGAELFLSKACYGCHKIEGVSNGKLGPELTRVGAKWPLDYLEDSIVWPRANNFESIMPIAEVSKEELRALTVYLKSLTGENLIRGPVERFVEVKNWKASRPAEVPVTAESGRKLFEEKHCNACHSINGSGGKIAPDLSVVGLQRTREWVIQHHRNPRSLVGGSAMPDFSYSETELSAIAEYLATLQKLETDNAAIYTAAKPIPERLLHAK